MYSRTVFDTQSCTWVITQDGASHGITTPYTIQLKNSSLYLSVCKNRLYWQRLYLEDASNPLPDGDHHWYFTTTLVPEPIGDTVTGFFFVQDKHATTFPMPYIMTYDEKIMHQTFTAITVHEQYIEKISLLNNLLLIKTMDD